MLTIKLSNFLAIEPWCEHKTAIAAVVEVLTVRECDRLVIINAQQQPIGIIYTTRLNLHLSELSKAKKQRLLKSALQDNPNLVEPLEVLPGDWSLEQFTLHLQKQNYSSNREWAVVDADAKYLGLVNSSLLFQYLGSSASENSFVNQLALDFLIEIVKKLPWAIVLQTSLGVQIAQSKSWQEHFGWWKDSGAIRQEITDILDSTTPNVSTQVNPLTDELPPSFSRCQLGTKPHTCVCVCPTADGKEKVWEFIKISLTNSTEDLSLLIANDISYQQQLASELSAKNAELIGLNRLKDEFLACISHELKTPITAVMGLSTLLKDPALGQLNDRQARYAGLINQSGRHLMAVVSDILDLTRMETGQIKLNLAPVKVLAICDRAHEQVKSMNFKAQDSNSTETIEEHRFTLEIEPGIDIFIADELRLRQMLVNMLSNAYKFTKPGGEVGLQINRWEGWIAFTVWDTGIGISEEQQHLIFQKFQQLENPLIRQFEGAGLGLVLTRALARLHGGDVTFLSKQGIGSCFTLLLPPSPPQKSIADEQTSLRSYPIRGQTPTAPAFLSLSNVGLKTTLPSAVQLRPNPLILVVEAAPQFVENLSEQLNTLGYRVVVARSGTEALEKSRRLQPVSIFLNPVLPLLSGWDVLTLLKADVATSQIPVIVTATGAQKEQALLNHADEFMILPVQNQNLQQILNRFCSIAPIFAPEDRDRPRCDLLTVLWLVTPFEPSLLTSSLLQLHHRVIEADDLEQAELLARIWQPNVVVIDGSILKPLDYVHQLSKHSKLKRLPLVTLNAATTEAANQVPGLMVFPCLNTDRDVTVNSLLAVLQVAAGISWQPSLLIVDIASLPDLIPLKVGEDVESAPKKEWFQALVQYLQTAGFQATMSQSWAEVMRQVQSSACSVDVMLISLGNRPFTPQAIQAFIALSKQENLPPILVLDKLNQDNIKPQSVQFHQPVESNHSYVSEQLSTEQTFKSVDLENIIEAIATRILPPSLSMKELLNYIHWALIGDE
ncbi:ATP-binding response regulator [Synechocystis sp. PCC 7509]|uniref:ATP-binding response regulator n=1 Tax=Synechocystis sp. PCC 7509 TaxID=927677 RepID=UPI0002D5ECBE|nr:hybrid sensor histidine kinase/response regulator [Synechocystis sp. PCC 7509]